MKLVEKSTTLGYIELKTNKQRANTAIGSLYLEVSRTDELVACTDKVVYLQL